MPMINILNVGGDEMYADWVSSILAGRNKTRMIVFDPPAPQNFDAWKPKFVDALKNIQLVVFTGGEDVDPSIYGHRKNERTYSNLSRDVFESEVFNITSAMGIKMFGICRGSQFLWAKLGGTLFQHYGVHNSRHSVLLTANHLYDAPMVKVNVNSTHHQMADYRSKPEDVEILAVAPQSVAQGHIFYNVQTRMFDAVNDVPDVEAWWTSKRKVLGIQWHPEMGSCPVEGSNYAASFVKRFMEIA